MKKNKHLGSTFDSFLIEEGIYDEVVQGATKKALVFRILHEMKRKRLTKVEMAKRMHTSRSELDRILDPDNRGVSLESLQKAAAAVGKAIDIRLVNATPRRRAAS
jgi:predicted XRE-type DNA-binding protein